MMDLWADIQTRGYAALRDLLGNAEESQSLEFKTKADPTSGKFGKDDKENLGKSLSGLSNAVGGLLIWGIDTKKDGKETGIAQGRRSPNYPSSRQSWNLWFLNTFRHPIWV